MRELNEYPTAGQRMRILSMAVLAVLIASYEGQIAPVVPLLLEDLHISLSTYGTVSATALVAGAIASAVGGRLTDTLGRVRLIVPLLMLTAVCCFLMTTVHSAGQLLAVRAVLSVVDGMAMAGTAPLVRDFSPRMGRAQAFGFWTWGPVGASFLAATVASLTLPLFDDSWRSQFVIMGAVSLVLSVVIAFNIADLSPELRARILQTEQQAVGRADHTTPPRVRDLFAQRAVWAHVVAISCWLVLYITLTLYGQTMLADSFGLEAATASQVMSAFWVLNILTLIVAGRVSDRLQLRKPLCLAGTVAAALLTAYLASLIGRDSVSHLHIAVTGALIGGAMGCAYGPWMANYSENAEDVDPRLQGTAWGVFTFLTKAMAVVVLVVVPHVVESHGWHGWLFVAVGCMALFVPASLLFRGPWRRPKTAPGPSPQPDVAPSAHRTQR
ncbi:MFS transporter [Streptomyces sp. Ru73]|uniref:MFS transporter n=1 Tax=Streptomyces sp. Ru73 TaxID=2080748 RepID=UPI0015E28199|nr:MFS transporter [Streptomyces sp. Ru73]